MTTVLTEPLLGEEPTPKSNFDIRVEPGVEFERELFKELNAHKDVTAIALNGTEHTHPDFVEIIRHNESDAAKFVRYAPDGVMECKSKRVIHFDAKAAKSIEKDAYNVYMKYHRTGCTVIIFVKHPATGMRYWQYVQNIQLLDSTIVVSQYPEHRRFPIDDDGWIAPRLKRGFKSTKKYSGTPFKYFDFDSFKTMDIRGTA